MGYVLRCSVYWGDAVLVDDDAREHNNAEPDEPSQIPEITYGEKSQRVCPKRAHFHDPSILATFSAIASEAVSPGDSMPNRFTSPATPCAARPWITKSAAG